MVCFKLQTNCSLCMEKLQKVDKNFFIIQKAKKLFFKLTNSNLPTGRVQGTSARDRP